MVATDKPPRQKPLQLDIRLL